MESRIAVVNGPNTYTFGKEINNEGNLNEYGREHALEVVNFRSNYEEEIVDFINEKGDGLDGIIINPGAFTAYGYTILKAILDLKIPFIEVHMSNIFAREPWNRKSIFSEKAVAVLAGLQETVYQLALQGVAGYIQEEQRSELMMEMKSKTKPFPIWPFRDEREKELMDEVVTSGHWSRSTGEMVRTFENNFAMMHDVRYCLGVTNGIHAIELALFAIGVGAKDQVIIPAFSSISIANAILRCNAIPVLVDVDEDTYCMDVDSFGAAVTPRTKAVIPVHMAGHCCDMDSILMIAEEHDIRVIEDASHALGGEWIGRKIGTLADFATFSFSEDNLITCGEGGALITNDKELYERAYLLHNLGRTVENMKDVQEGLESNYRMNEFQGAILIAQLERLPKLNELREKNVRILDALLETVSGIIPQKRDGRVSLNPHYMYMFYYDNSFFDGMEREEFIKRLKEEGVPSFISDPVISVTTKVMEEEVPIENARKIAKEVVYLPHFTLIGDEQDLYEISNAIIKIQKMSK